MKNTTLWSHKLRLGTAIALIAASSTVSGQGVTVFGSHDCGTWVVDSSRAKSWLLGYLSGLNAATASAERNYDPLGKVTSAAQIYLWMDNYCKANPLDTVGDGALDLYLELIARR
jgi:hypothetical protein